MLRCPKCKGNVLQKSESGHRLRVRGAIEIDDNGQAHGQCYWCKSAISLPLQFARPEDQLQKGPKFVIPVGKSATDT